MITRFHKWLMMAAGLVIILELALLLGAFMWPRFGIQLAAVWPALVIGLTNKARLENQLPAVKTNDLLTLAAQTKAQDMALKGYFAHISPEGTKPWFWLDQAGYRYRYAGENLAVNFSDSERMVKAWRSSPAHNMNLLGPRYTEIGVGTATGLYQGKPALFVVQFFASPL